MSAYDPKFPKPLLALYSNFKYFESTVSLEWCSYKDRQFLSRNNVFKNYIIISNLEI